MENSECHIELVGKLLYFLYSKNTLSDKDIKVGLMFIVNEFDDTTIDVPLAPKFLGEIVGMLYLVGATYFRVLKDITVKVDKKSRQREIFDSSLCIYKSRPSTGALGAHGDDLIECGTLIE